MWIAAFGDNVEIESAQFYHWTPQLAPTQSANTMRAMQGLGDENWRKTLNILHFYVLTRRMEYSTEILTSIDVWQNIVKQQYNRHYLHIIAKKIISIYKPMVISLDNCAIKRLSGDQQ